ncbi:hypothetical protein BDR04DRAFT_1234246 [Suillus decipiens]|nr:hypothetical protein BDR04DRAFT_1234246 [Suillus decipiens]
MPCGRNDAMHANKLTAAVIYTHTAYKCLGLYMTFSYLTPSGNVSCRPQAPVLLRLKAIAGIVLTIVAAIATSFRLLIRARHKRLWIDDAWAALGVIFNLILLIADCLYLQDYVPRTFFRRVLISTAITFGIVWVLLFSQLWWICEKFPSWKTQPHPQCDLGRGIAITQMITDVLGDFVLILPPFCLLYKVRLSRPQKVRVLSVFSASSITTVVSLVHAYYVFSDGGLKVIMAAIVEAPVSLIVANLSVVVAFIFRLKAEEEMPSTSTPIITFGSQPRKRIRDPLATTFVGAENTAIVLKDFSESLPRSLKASDDDENSMNNREGKQTNEWLEHSNINLSPTLALAVSV